MLSLVVVTVIVLEVSPVAKFNVPPVYVKSVQAIAVPDNVLNATLAHPHTAHVTVETVNTTPVHSIDDHHATLIVRCNHSSITLSQSLSSQSQSSAAHEYIVLLLSLQSFAQVL